MRVKWLSFPAVFFAAMCACGEPPAIPDVENNEPPLPASSVQWGVVSSTAQIVRESADPDVCHSGWTELTNELNRIGEGALPALQPDYVNRFKSVYDFVSAAIEARPLIQSIPTLRLSLVWPCWMTSSVWRDEMTDAIVALQHAGYTIELTLSHHDSYPGELHDGTSNFGIAKSGWAHDLAPLAFKRYAEFVVDDLADILPKGTRVYLINEPVAMLFNSYLGSGTWPPGGKRAGTGFAKAMINMRDGLHDAISVVTDAGWEPAIAKNIRMMLPDTPAANHLDYIFNWWLLDALVRGCRDNSFSEECDGGTPSDLRVVGLTYYGSMRASEETVTLNTDGGALAMSLPEMDFAPNSAAFGNALDQLALRYNEVAIGVAEIGFSSIKIDTMAEWLTSYRDEVLRLAGIRGHIVPFIEVHTLFESAEFTSGEWQFHLVEGACLSNNQACSLTSWGSRLMEIIEP